MAGHKAGLSLILVDSSVAVAVVEELACFLVEVFGRFHLVVAPGCCTV